MLTRSSLCRISLKKDHTTHTSQELLSIIPIGISHAIITYVEDFIIQNVGVDICATRMCQIVKWPLKLFLDNLNVRKTYNQQTIWLEHFQLHTSPSGILHHLFWIYWCILDSQSKLVLTKSYSKCETISIHKYLHLLSQQTREVTSRCC